MFEDHVLFGAKVRNTEKLLKMKEIGRTMGWTITRC
jgi:hypothetical protein